MRTIRPPWLISSIKDTETEYTLRFDLAKVPRAFVSTADQTQLADSDWGKRRIFVDLKWPGVVQLKPEPLYSICMFPTCFLVNTRLGKGLKL